MKSSIVNPSAQFYTYAIREIVEVANRVKAEGIDISWQNIGDPMSKGAPVAPWIKDIVSGLVEDDKAWGYCPTAGMLETREFIASEVAARGGTRISVDDIIFFNGLGDAISALYSMLDSRVRVVGPSPLYSSHAIAESAHCLKPALTYQRDPFAGWKTDLDQLRGVIRANSDICAILIINPDNPTGQMYSRAELEELVDIARENNLFIIADEIYSNVTYGTKEMVFLSEVLGDDVPGISMRGISKEYPWPGSRCGWIEVYNKSVDNDFSAYADALLAFKRTQVCATTIPQMSIPLVMGDSRYPAHLKERADIYKERAAEAVSCLQNVNGISVTMPDAAFYLTVAFEDGVLREDQSLTIENNSINSLIESLSNSGKTVLDLRFVYNLLGATGICVVPLTGFSCSHYGFRMTLLDAEKETRSLVYSTLASSIAKYLDS